MVYPDIWVDNNLHQLHWDARIFACDRDIEALRRWHDHALLLSSDTDCLSLWDRDGLIRLTRVGVYPQDMTIRDDLAYVCGGADGALHLLHLPDLQSIATYHLPGLPERICLHLDTAYILSLLTEPEVHTLLITLNIPSGQFRHVQRFAGIPEAITADERGLWIDVSEGVTRLHWPDLQA